MKKLSILTFLLIASCATPEFYMNGKPYRTEKRCVEKIQERKYGYHKDYDWLVGDITYHWVFYWDSVCVKQVIDTIEIIKK